MTLLVENLLPLFQILKYSGVPFLFFEKISNLNLLHFLFDLTNMLLNGKFECKNLAEPKLKLNWLQFWKRLGSFGIKTSGLDDEQWTPPSFSFLVVGEIEQCPIGMPQIWLAKKSSLSFWWNSWCKKWSDTADKSLIVFRSTNFGTQQMKQDQSIQKRLPQEGHSLELWRLLFWNSTTN